MTFWILLARFKATDPLNGPIVFHDNCWLHYGFMGFFCDVMLHFAYELCNLNKNLSEIRKRRQCRLHIWKIWRTG